MKANKKFKGSNNSGSYCILELNKYSNTGIPNTVITSINVLTL
jgi:hypothetical protein